MESQDYFCRRYLKTKSRTFIGLKKLPGKVIWYSYDAVRIIL